MWQQRNFFWQRGNYFFSVEEFFPSVIDSLITVFFIGINRVLHSPVAILVPVVISFKPLCIFVEFSGVIMDKIDARKLLSGGQN